ncbi:MAG: BatD family protein [Oleiphilus sp.]
MVVNRLVKIVSFLSLLFVMLTAQANTVLTASVDRNKIYEIDTLNLTIQGQIDMELSFGGLMSFGLGQNEAPEIPGLEDNFDILDTQQSYNMQSINGESMAKVYWKYTLAPKKTGTLTIPSASYKGAQTQAITVNVIQGKAPKSASEPPAVFFEVETDKQEAYVQEQIIYTLRLYTQGLVNGELSEPSSTDAIFEPLGDQKKYYRMAFNQRYEVVERQYLIFPQKSGQLIIPEQTFQGVSLKQGRRTRLRDISESIELSIKPPAAGFSGTHWLPATSLFINESWQGDPEQLKVGDSLTRKIELSALGLLGSALPPVTMPEHPLIKLYADKPITESAQHESGVQSKRSDSFALIAIGDGKVALDEIRIPWWDTVNDVERVAIIPARTLDINVNPQIASQASPQKTLSTSEMRSEPSQPKQKTTDTDHPETSLGLARTESSQNHLWQSVSAVLLVLWAMTGFFLYRKIHFLQRQIDAIPLPKQKQQTNEKSLFDDAMAAIKAGEAQLIPKIIHWLRVSDELSGKKSHIQSLNDIKLYHEELYELLSEFDESLYASHSGSKLNKDKLLSLCKALRAKIKEALNDGSRKNKETHLQPFYR